MAFCEKCGHQLTDGAKFCFECGEKVSNSTTSNSQRKIIYEGELHKCPNCGEVLGSFDAMCPSCKFEIEGRQPSSSLKNFISEVEECEKHIVSVGANKTGWEYWSSSKRFCWIILNILFVCLPLAIYYVIQSLTMKTTPKLTSEENKLSSLVENFLFPNDRASIIEGLVFTKEKIQFIANQPINRKNAYWHRLWRTKAEQLKQKADMLFPGDSIVTLNYNEILKIEDRTNNAIHNKRIISWIIIGSFIVLFATSYFLYTPANSSFEWKSEGLYACLPVPSSSTGKIIIDNEKQLNFELHGVSKTGFEQYVNDCIELGFTTNTSKTDFTFVGTNQNGDTLTITYYNVTEAMNVMISSFNN